MPPDLPEIADEVLLALGDMLAAVEAFLDELDPDPHPLEDYLTDPSHVGLVRLALERHREANPPTLLGVVDDG